MTILAQRLRRLAMLAASVALAMLALLGGARTAHAAPELVELAWDAPAANCPTRADVERAIREQADVDPRVIGPVLTARARVLPQAPRFHLHLETRNVAGAVGERDLEGDTCAQVADAAALVIALALHAEVETHAETRESTAVQASSVPLRISVRAEVAGGLGMIPAVAPGAGLAVAVSRAALRVEAQAEGWLPRTTDDGPRPATGGSVALVAGGVRGCIRPFSWKGEISVCTGPSLGEEIARGIGLRSDASGSGFWAAWMAGFQGGLHIASRVWLRGGVELGPRITAPTFVVDGFGSIYRSAPWEGRAWLGLELDLP